MKKPLVIYHGGCRDGFCAAWVISTRFGAENLDFHAGYYGQPPPDCKGRDVVIVDFSYPLPEMEQIRDTCATLLVLDHHKTAQATLEGFSTVSRGSGAANTRVVFDMERSGAGLAWDEYFPAQPRCWVVDYTEDRDLWRFRLPQADRLCAYLSVLPFEFDVWSVACEANPHDFFVPGDAVIAKTKQYVAEVRKNARRWTFEGHDVPLVNAPQVDISELLSAMCDGETFAMGWWQRADGVFQYSLRSRGDFDVSALAKKHGGGGHKNAAGFQSASLLP